MSSQINHDNRPSICQVAVPVPMMRARRTIYDYISPENTELSVGQIVLVPVANRQCWGIVTGTISHSDISPERLKRILKCADAPPLSHQNLHYLDQLSKWTLAPFSAAMKLMLNCPQALEALPRNMAIILLRIVLRFFRKAI